MENNKLKVCPGCGTENLPEYVFCKNCGSPLQAAASQQTDYTQVSQQPVQPQEEGRQGAPSGNGGTYGDYINGVPTAMVADYVGTGKEKFIPKFFKYSRGAKAGWNWPVFLFGLILGVPFVWFLYRKMYKLGAIFVAVSVALAIGNGCAMYSMFNSIDKPMRSFVDEICEIEETYDGKYSRYSSDVIEEKKEEQIENATKRFVEEVITDGNVLSMSVVLELLSVVNLAYIIMASIFANYLYYKQAFSDISKIRSSGNVSPEIVRAAGGTNSAAGVLSGVFGYIVLSAIVAVPVLFVLFDIISYMMKNLPVGLM